ncbi:MAG: PIN/TRAM domain-containing protein [Eubacterium sp.]|nr:PIN/TRAM domain-containing protein [Eubacterium sp.]
MLQKVLRICFAIVGLLLGAALGSMLLGSPWMLQMLGGHLSPQLELGIYVVLIIVFGLIFFILFPLILAGVKKLTSLVEESMEEVRLIDVGLGIFGLIVGLVIAMLVSFAFARIPFLWISSLLTAVVYIVLGYLGFTLPIKRRDDIVGAFQNLKRDRETGAAARKIGKKKQPIRPKLLDTSVAIDGRIYDIYKSGFMEGPLVVPVFVLGELQIIADSSDDLKRSKGRRGLDIIRKMQEDFEGVVQISEEDFEDIHEVDGKLIRLAKDLKYKILTNDYNLNKVAAVQGVEVLNINELANAVKPVVLPGEEMKVLLIKNGKEAGQAVGYLDDGTMIVVENARRHVGEYIPVTVTSILQTAAGRMIFAKVKK